MFASFRTKFDIKFYQGVSCKRFVADEDDRRSGKTAIRVRIRLGFGDRLKWVFFDFRDLHWNPGKNTSDFACVFFAIDTQ